MTDFHKIRYDFPIMQQTAHGKSLVYLDNAATSQKPQAVIDAVSRYYKKQNANVHRGVYELSEKATLAFENTRELICEFINAEESAEIIFTKGTTESINLIAQSFSQQFLKPGDQVLISHLEHHSNIVPWQVACQNHQAELKVIPILDNGQLDLEAFEKMLSSKIKILALSHVSNALGTINPIKKMIEQAHAHNIAVLIDGAQGAPHMSIDVQDLNCDFYVFSAHKMYGPTGVGVLYGKRRWLEALPPYQTGGEMISRVTFAKTEYNVLPHKFEAGTMNIAGIIGLNATIQYLKNIGMAAINDYEHQLLMHATAALETVPGLKIIGQAPQKAAVISFVLDKIHPHDIGTILDHEGIAIRAGHHCAMPLMERYQLPATARASFGIYNNEEDIECLVKGLHKVIQLFNGV